MTSSCSMSGSRPHLPGGAPAARETTPLRMVGSVPVLQRPEMRHAMCMQEWSRSSRLACVGATQLVIPHVPLCDNDQRVRNMAVQCNLLWQERPDWRTPDGGIVATLHGDRSAAFRDHLSVTVCHSTADIQMHMYPYLPCMLRCSNFGDVGCFGPAPRQHCSMHLR